MRETYDLTTAAGARAAESVLAKVRRVLDSPVMWLVSPPAKLAYELAKRGDNARQGEVARDLIRAGKEQGLRRLKIRMRETAGIDLGAPIHGVPIKVKVGADGTMEIEAEYK